MTGSSGFLGKCLMPELSTKYIISTLGIAKSDQYKIDLSTYVPKFESQFDLVVHMAGKAHSTPTTIEEKDSFFRNNLSGTKNLCLSLENSLPRAFIFISTVAVYGLESGENIDETYPLIGNTPYAQSKIQAEAFLKGWCEEHGVILTILRPALIAGEYPPGNLGAMINGIKSGKYLRIGSGHTRKSMLMARDIAHLIPKVIDKGGTYNVCDNTHPSFYELEELISKQLGKGSPMAIPMWIARLLASFGDLLGSKAPINSAKLIKITQPLTFSNEKAKRELQWEPLDVLENFKIQ